MAQVYLAGTIGGLSYTEATGWRAYASRRLADSGIVAIDPLRSEPNQWGEHPIDPWSGTHLQSSARAITARSRMDAKRCDAMLAFLDGSQRMSAGTLIEMGWADENHRPIVAVIPRDDDPHNHPIVRETADFVVASVEQAIDVIEHLFAYET